MNICSIYLPQIKTNFENKSNLRFNNTMATDVFERSGISFGKSNKNISKRTLVENLGFSEEQADIIISCGFNNGNHYQKMKILLGQGCEFDCVIKILKNVSSDIRIAKDEPFEESIKSYYLKNTEDIERYETLSLDSELDVIDKISVIAYELNDNEIERYKALKSFPLETHEMLLAVKFGLSDEQIQKFDEIKSCTTLFINPLEHLEFCTFSVDETMQALAKNLKQHEIIAFAYSKTLAKDLTKDTVRKKGGMQKITTKVFFEFFEFDRWLNEKMGKKIRELRSKKSDFGYRCGIDLWQEALGLIIRENNKLDEANMKFNTDFKTSDEFAIYLSSQMSAAKGRADDYYKELDPSVQALVKNSLLNCFLSTVVMNPKIKSDEFLEKLPNNFWHSTCMGCEEETFGVIQKALKSIEENTLETSLIASDEFLEIFNVKLSQANIDDKSILVVKKDEKPLYVAYNGAIAPVKEVKQYDNTQFSAWGNIDSHKQAHVLASAASSFPFDLFDDQGICIIGKNAPAFDIKQTSDQDIQSYYCDRFFDLKQKGNLNAQEILKLMPKNCMLSINPYIQEGGMLYSIVCEWISADNTRWQIEIHSQDMKWHSDDEWIFRFSKEKDGVKNYFVIEDDNSSYNFNGEFLGDDAHIRIVSPFQSDDLLNKVEFQNQIRQKSIDLYTDFEIDKIIDKLGIAGKDEMEKKYNLVDYCLKNPLAFAKYKDEILNLRASLGMIELV